MQRRSLLLLAALLLPGCPAKDSGESGGPGGVTKSPEEIRSGLLALDGLPTEEFLWRAAPLLAAIPGPRDASSLARALDQTLRLECDTHCHVEERN